MPFVNQAQRKACYAQQRQANEKGIVAKWDCHEFGLDLKKSPRRKSTRRKSTKRVQPTPKKVGTKNGEIVFQGVKGGKYLVRKNKKVYF